MPTPPPGFASAYRASALPGLGIALKEAERNPALAATLNLRSTIARRAALKRAAGRWIEQTQTKEENSKCSKL